ncbi:hypothetical protein F4776DRAFT_125844 [Hypoxylon sp. NC0597]|nr:hypothetical protein F4776DRAFT_125844 [Hypoxylon sp. NC0597]
MEPSWLLYALSRRAYRYDYMAFFDLCSQILANFARESEKAKQGKDENSDEPKAATAKQNENEEGCDDS